MIKITTLGKRPSAIYALFAISLASSALLLFWVQPLIAKALLPAFGGVPDVWGGCLIFFQSVILAAYGYVAILNRFFKLRVQVLIHIVLLASTTVFALPLNQGLKHLDALYQHSPILAVLAELVFKLGLPTFILATSSPLLQTWVAQIYPGLGQSVYSLYAVSNAGSLFATLGYPFLIEPTLSLNRQAGAWTAMFLGYILLAIACACLAYWLGKAITVKDSDNVSLTNEPEVAVYNRWRWLLLSAIPTSLLLGVTNYVTSTIAPTPLLWLVPLSLYLLAFILAFSRRSRSWRFKPALLVPASALLLTLTIVAEATEPAWALALLHLAGFFILNTATIYELATAKPSIERLPEYYFMIALGGWLGGAFNMFLAPQVFDKFWEYPLMIVLACLVSVREQKDGAAHRTILTRAILLDCVYALSVGVLIVLLARFAVSLKLEDVARIALVFGIPLVLVNHLFRSRPRRFALAIGAAAIAGALTSESMTGTLYSSRNFFGALRVTSKQESGVNSLINGNSIHGKQFTEPNRRCAPISHYYPEGPVGDIIKSFEFSQTAKSVAVIGLGVGTMASYAQPGYQWTFYELNPEIIKIARNKDYFTYLSDCARVEIKIVPGDARLKLSEALNNSFGLIVLDAFNSNVIPTHLLTREAIGLYLSKLGDNGLLAFHVSNRSLDLRPVLATAADAAGAECLWRRDPGISPARGDDASEWVVLVRRTNTLESLKHLLKWENITAESHGLRGTVWTDDYASLIKIIRW
jgi:hypothetical protein